MNITKYHAITVADFNKIQITEYIICQVVNKNISLIAKND